MSADTARTTGTPRSRRDLVGRLLGLVVGLALLIAGLLLFHRLGEGALAAPPLADPNAWPDWAASRDPLVVVAAAGRLVVVALGWYLAAVVAAGTLARLVRAVRLVRVLDAVSVAPVRRLLDRAVGVGLAATVIAGVVPGAGWLAAPAVAEVEVESLDESRPLPLDLVEVARDGSVTANPAPDATAPAPDATAAAPDATAAAPDATAVAPDATGEAPRVQPTTDASPVVPVVEPDAAPEGWHDVQAGESFWTIAAGVLEAAWGRAPSDAEVVGYWRQLIDANRDRLSDPDNPDLVFPGQRFDVPAPRSAPP